jgi:hypothetical protein
MNKTYWFRGGKIAVSIYIIGLIIISLLFSGFQPAWFFTIFFLVSVFPFGDHLNGYGEYFLGLGAILLICFFIGAFIGLIVERNHLDLNSRSLVNKRIKMLGAILLVFFLVFSYFTTTPKYNSISDCTSSINKMRTGFREDLCYSQVARVTRDVSVCNNFEHLDYSADSYPQSLREYSKYQCYSEVGSQGNIHVCSQIPTDRNIANGTGTHLKSDCYFYASRLENCETLSPNQYEVDFCNLSKIGAFEGLSDEALKVYCVQIKDQYLKNECISRDATWRFK